MKYSTKLSDAVHILTFIALSADQPLSSTEISVSIQTNPAYVRQLMAKLKAASLIQSTRGQAKPTLSRAAQDISLLDVYHAVEGDKPLLHLDTHTNPDCGVGVNIQYALADYYARVQDTAEQEMQQITLHDIIVSYYNRTSAVSDSKDFTNENI